MFNETTKTQRIIMGVTAVIAGIFMMYFAPTQGMQTLKIALENVMERLIPFDPDFYPAVPILGATYSIWMVLLWLTGAFAIVLAKKVYDGEEWARSTMLGIVAIPSVAGMTMLIPWMVLVVSDYSNGPVAGILPPPEGLSKMPPVLWTMVFGLIFYYVFLLADKDDLKNKALKIIPYTFLGVVAGMVFMNGQHGVRYFIFIPEYLTYTSSFDPLGNFFTNLDHYDALALVKTSQAQIDAGQITKTAQAVYDPNTLTLLLGGFMNYASSYLMILSIPFLAMRKKFGYYTVLATALATALIGFDGYFVRHSFEWAVGGLMSLALFGMFLLPVFKRMFVPVKE
ncbi:MAG: hypothetical protein D8M58_18290 [Calditrichaeota bacterium]|nr:MAG: hypothetical protein DWQ03_11520 [Calditrichota bacterium]MBL1207360.1 hypothetical protein [Calditrichota bacterium]NOG47192.1 hypothetical protein [Calditrichota bacterium]